MIYSPGAGVVGSAGTAVPGAIISSVPVLDPASTNILLQSAAFSSATWVKSGGLVVNADTALAPNGLVEADTLDDNTAGLGEASQGVAVANDALNRVYSVYVRPGTSNQAKIGLRLTGGVAVESFLEFNPLSGASIAAQGTASAVAIIVDGVTWFRITVVVQNNGTGNVLATPYIQPASAGAGAVGTLIAWGAQLEENRNVATGQIPTLAAAIARVADALPVWLQQILMSVQVLVPGNVLYTRPQFLGFALVIVQASGGGGGDSNNGTQSGGGAGAGGFAISLLTAAAIGASQVTAVGAGGVAAGGAGNATSFGALLSATGGIGGGFNNGSAGAGGTGTGGNLWNGKGGDGNITGGANFNSSGNSFLAGTTQFAAVAGLGAGGGPSTPAGANSKAGGDGRIIILEFAGRQA